MIKKILSLGGACLLAWASLAQADEEVVVKLRGPEDFGSGPSLLDNLYSPGGLEPGGLFLGNPNNLTRRDRVLLKYDIKPLLLSASRVKSAQLVYYIDYVYGPDETREIAIEHFSEPVTTFDGTSVNSAGVEDVAIMEAALKDAVNGGSGSGAGQPQEVDVTEALKNSLARGDTSCAFRLKDTRVESSAASTDPVGVIIVRSEAKQPILRVILND